jgi:adenylate kinase family enzyme
MITIKKNESPNLPAVHMNCDKPLHPKLDNYELTKFLNRHATTLFLGKPGSGKSHLCQSFFRSAKVFRKVFHNIYIFRPEESKKTVNDDIFENLPEDQQYYDLNADTLAEVISKVRAEAAENFNSCIIFDDMAAKLKNNATMHLFKELIFNRRQFRCSIIFLVQTWKSVPRELRKSFTNMFIFRVGKAELKDIFDEAVELDNQYLVPISNLVYDKQYNYLFFNIDGKRIFKNFDEIIIQDE